MSVKHLITCDSPDCTESCEYLPFRNTIEKQLPEKWITAKPSDQGQEPLTFCSWGCLYWYGHKKIIGAGR